VRGRIQAALRGHATVQWFGSFVEIRCALEQGERAITAVIALSDAYGGTAMSFAHDVREDMTGTAVVVCCNLRYDSQAPIAALAEAGVHDILFAGMNDEGHAARTVIFGAALGSAADVVMRAVGSSIPDVLTRFVDLVVRRPRELPRGSVLAAADARPVVPRATVYPSRGAVGVGADLSGRHHPRDHLADARVDRGRAVLWVADGAAESDP